ncbi:type II toxin-antitoxin system VapC family toxin [Amycolatopsis thermoflava]|uniref:type II toxin-antitoxin system VapC family toxin n=1 Tax=Amycolatopsis thermoflava TaxID=84480 RepID=UPI00381B8D80
MADALARVAIDTSVVMAVLLKEQDRIEPSSWVLDQHRRAHTCVVPAIVLAEIPGNKSVRAAGGTAKEKRARQRRVQTALEWVRANRMQVIDVDEGVARAAAELASTYGLTGADACVVAGAISVGCERVYTWDTGLIKNCAKLTDVEVTTPSIPPGTQAELTFDR